MSLFGALASLFVEIKPQGMENVAKAFADVSAGLGEVAKDTAAQSSRMNDNVRGILPSVGGLASAWQALGSVIPTLKVNLPKTPEIPAPETPTIESPKLPPLTFPPITVPGLSAPTVPSIEAPEVPGLAAPKVGAPKVPDLAAPKIPGLTAPTVPEIPAPKVGAPQIPPLTAPTVPPLTFPAPKIPPVKPPPLPDLTAPKIPALTFPPVKPPPLPQLEVPPVKPPPLPEVAPPKVETPAVKAPAIGAGLAGLFPAIATVRELAATTAKMAAAKDLVKALTPELSPLAAANQEVADLEKKTAALQARLAQGGLGNAFKGLSQTLQGVAGAFSMVTAPLQGMVMSGIHASGAGEVLAIQFTELNRQMASIFVPTINYVIGRLNALIGWFRSLTGDQQAQLRQWGLLAAGIGLTATILPRVIASVQALGVAFKGLQAVMTGLSLTNPWLLAIAGIGLLIASTMEMKDVMAIANAGAKQMAQTFGDIRDVVGDIVGGVRGIASDLGLSKLAHGGKEGGGKGPGFIEQANFYSNTRALFKPLEDALRQAGMPKLGSGLATAGGVGMTPILGPLMTGLRMTGVLPESWFAREHKEGKGEKRQELPPRLSGFEAIEATYRRVAQTTRNIAPGKTPAEDIDAKLEPGGAVGQALIAISKAIENMKLVK